MKPIAYFEAAWNRCAHLKTLHAYLANNVSSILQPDELLRAEWVARVSVLDLYIHELVAQGMVEIFEGIRPTTPGYLKFKVTNDTLDRIRAARRPIDASSAFDLDVRNQLSFVTYQAPDKIADGIKFISTIELWNEVALKCGANLSTQNIVAKDLKKDLSLIVERRNKIAHEGDLQPTPPRHPWPITSADVLTVGSTIEKIVRAIDSCV